MLLVSRRLGSGVIQVFGAATGSQVVTHQCHILAPSTSKIGVGDMQNWSVRVLSWRFVEHTAEVSTYGSFLLAGHCDHLIVISS